MPAPDVTLVTPFLGGSTIYRLRPMVNLMLEAVFTWRGRRGRAGRSERSFGSLLSPGVRGGWNLGDEQIIVGAALPIVWANDDTDVGIFSYFSFEFRSKPK